MLVSVHLPKTAGMSFRASLEEHFGEQFSPDYGDRPMNITRGKRNRFAFRKGLQHFFAPPKRMECIHGHFMPAKYTHLRHAQFVTWFRDPIERLASQYYFWKRQYNPQTQSLMQRRLVEEDWSFERFCMGEEFRNFYHQYLWRFPLQRFAFIGITEHYETDLVDFSESMLGVKLEPKEVNRNPDSPASYFEDSAFRRRVEAHNEKDLGLYRQALEMRAARQLR